MPELELPEGQYFSLSGLIAPSTGGKTRALLMRNRVFATKAGVAPIILTFDQKPHYPYVRDVLRKRGELVDPMQLVNIYEWYREHDVDHLPPVDDELPAIEGFDAIDVVHPDGTVYVTHWTHPRSGREIALDFKRADGSVFLRMPPPGAYGRSGRATDVLLVNTDGRPVGHWPGMLGFRQNWIRTLTPAGQRSFIISDSQSAINYILPMPGDDVHVLHVMHNAHISGDWFAPIWRSYKTLLGQIDNLDGFVTLTARQGEDVAERFGRTDNMYVVPNPVELPDRPDPLPVRARARFTMVCRLELQKRVDEAVRVFAQVLRDEPDATLDIYGDGSQMRILNALITKLGLQDSVRLMGHDHAARESLWTSTGFLVTSKFEGFPLATLESFSFGCPIIAYDVKYGVREQITDGIDGYLLTEGDTRGMADRIVGMIRDPDLVQRLSAGAFAKADQHDYRAFMRDWRHVLNAVVRKKDRRTELTSVKLTVKRLDAVGGRLGNLSASADRVTRLARRTPIPTRIADVPARIARRVTSSSASASFPTSPSFSFAGRLTVAGSSPRAGFDDIVLSLDAVSNSTGAVVPIRLATRRHGNRFDLSATFDAASVFDATTDTTTNLRLRLRLVWHNSSWETWVRRSAGVGANYELAFASNREAVLWRAPR